ncbi:MAG: FAD-dependent oxidoreductase [Chloroflexi bacterium]|nr:FAD-dependent oxidoreductase [Chloroflexota bacterium]
MLEHARAVIIGGGVGGTSIAYHLTALGWTDIVLLDRSDLTSGSTFHSAGLVGQLRSSVPLTKMMMYSVELYRRLAAETGIDPGWREVGSLRIASTTPRMEELRRQAGWAKTFGLPVELISAEEAQRLFPPMVSDGVLGGVYMPTDGYLDPSNLALALARGARSRGAAIYTNTRVLGISKKNGRVTGVVTDKGNISTDVVVIAGGMYTPELARLAGVNVPIIPMEHQYLLTGELEGIDARLPQLRDPDNLVYFRQEAGGLLMGGYERNPKPWSLNGVPANFNGKLLNPDHERFVEIMEGAIKRVPAMETADVVRFVNGPEAFTPDGEFILGESSVDGLFVAAGFCAHGIAGAGGIGTMLAEWVVEGTPSLDLWKMDIRRFGAHYRSQRYALARTYEVYATYYDITYPNHEREAGRPLRLSPVYGRLQEFGAVFGEKSGWERVNWFESNAQAGSGALRPRGWAGQHWSPAIAAEHQGARERAAIFDETSFAKVEISGTDVVPYLQYLCANDMDRPVGTVIYTQLLNERGGIECDVTITRLAEDRYRLITGTAFGQHDIAWLRRNLARGGHGGRDVRIADVTSMYACLGVWGPRARDIVSGVTRADVSNEAFPFLTAQEIEIGDVPCLAVRVTYVGELGWEFYCPSEFAVRLWDTLCEAGKPYGMVAGGYRAIDSLRLEKGYRVWSSDISPETNPYEAGLGFAVRLKKSTDFIGKAALLAAREAGPTRKLCCLVLGIPEAVALTGEPVRSGSRIVGRVTSGGYGYTVQQRIAYAYLPIAEAQVGHQLEVEIFGEWISATVAAEPLWDPKGVRIRA